MACHLILRGYLHICICTSLTKAQSLHFPYAYVLHTTSTPFTSSTTPPYYPANTTYSEISGESTWILLPRISSLTYPAVLELIFQSVRTFSRQLIPWPHLSVWVIPRLRTGYQTCLYYANTTILPGTPNRFCHVKYSPPCTTNGIYGISCAVFPTL